MDITVKSGDKAVPIDTLKEAHPAIYNQLVTEMAALEEYGLSSHTGTFGNLHPETIDSVIKALLEPLSESPRPIRVAMTISLSDTAGLSLRYRYEAKTTDGTGVEKWEPLKDILSNRFLKDLV